MGILSEDIIEVSDNVVNYYNSFGKKYKLAGVYTSCYKSEIFKCINSSVLSKSINKFNIDYSDEIIKFENDPIVIDLIKFILESLEQDIIHKKLLRRVPEILNLPIFTGRISVFSEITCLTKYNECSGIDIKIVENTNNYSKIRLYFVKR